ncbi:hypothetical protein D9758_013728 [Tetrapyrgos nigripes]|uniref:HAT C-terminal dimerisation domain-containing protein n=1 Tax=Tetrapyrgos nigripes TaxID=182062 RepID=A0A8H5G1P4_9AGAR|nr:hypothetical protein D9758_013728 [Tetrapyrgos nigripes]
MDPPSMEAALQSKEKKRKSISTAKANSEDPIESALPTKKAKTSGKASGSEAPKKAKPTPKTVVQAAAKKLKDTLSKTKSKKTIGNSDEPDLPQPAPSKAFTVDIDENSDDEVQPAPSPPKKSTGPKATVIDADDEDDDGSDSNVEEVLQEETDEAELGLSLTTKAERLMKGWHSVVYAFFEPIPTVEYIKGRKCQVFTCSSPSCKKKIHQFQDTGDAKAMKTLQNHVNTCKAWGPDAIATVKELTVPDAHKSLSRYLRDGTITMAFQRGRKGRGTVTYSPKQHTRAETRAELVRWVAESSRPFAIVKDRGFQCLMKTGRPGYYLPHPTTIARDVKTVFAKTCLRIALMLKLMKTIKEYDGDLNFATDAWTSPNHRAYVAVSVHLEKEGVPISFLLDFVEVAKTRLKEAEEGGEVVNNDPDLVVDMMEGMSPAEKEELRQQIVPVQQVVVKFQKTSYKIINSPTGLLPEWRHILHEEKQPQTVIPRDVTTRWNSSCDMIEYCIEKKKYYRAITSEDLENGLQQYALTKREWKLAEQLKDVLEVLRDATLFFYRSTPNLATVVPVLDEIDRKFTEWALNTTLDPAIHAAVSLAKKTLNKYYGKFDYSEVYRVAMVLHPHHKLNYFKTAEWPESWKNMALEIVRDVYERDYKSKMTVENDAMDVDEPETPVKPSKRNQFDDLPALKAPRPDNLSDELDRYLKSDVEKVKDVVEWWHGRKKSYPVLHRMALDYLTIPATSTDVERIFSRSRFLLPYVRNRLSAETTRALMCLSQWSLLGLIDDNDVVEVSKLPEIEVENKDAEDIEMPVGFDDMLGTLSDM